jgi:hypothetical protein
MCSIFIKKILQRNLWKMVRWLANAVHAYGNDINAARNMHLIASLLIGNQERPSIYCRQPNNSLSQRQLMITQL